jgi:hypothetical protein
MTYSPLTDRRMPPTGTFEGRKKWSARPVGVRINGLNVHHWAGTNMSGLNRLVYSNDPASANYLILNDGTLIGSVPEEFRAWTTSAYANDDDKITVEIQNETGAPSWRVSDAAIATLVRLYADLAKRHKFSPTRANLKGHQEYGIATACPGPYLLPRLDDVARRAAALGTTNTPEVPDMDNTQAKQLSETRAIAGKLEALIDELHAGIAPKIPTSATQNPEWINFRAAMRDVHVGVTRELDEAVAQGVAAALEGVTGVDQAAITAGVVAEVRKHVQAVTDSVRDTTYVMTPKEN